MIMAAVVLGRPLPALTYLNYEIELLKLLLAIERLWKGLWSWTHNEFLHGTPQEWECVRAKTSNCRKGNFIEEYLVAETRNSGTQF